MFRSCLLLPGAARLFPAQLHWDGSSKSWALPQMTGEIGGAQQNIEQLVSLQTFHSFQAKARVEWRRKLGRPQENWHRVSGLRKLLGLVLGLGLERRRPAYESQRRSKWK